jgi:acetylornithine/N-succinyldiaminopimelate aminotransferase
MGAVLMSDSVAEKIKTGDIASTFGGGPVACAAHLAVLDTIEREALVAHAAELGEAMHRQLGVGPVEAVLGCGCLVGLRVRGDAKMLHRRLMERGFITGTSVNPQVLRLMPPINMPFEAVLELAGALKDMEGPAQ